MGVEWRLVFDWGVWGPRFDSHPGWHLFGSTHPPFFLTMDCKACSCNILLLAIRGAYKIPSFLTSSVIKYIWNYKQVILQNLHCHSFHLSLECFQADYQQLLKTLLFYSIQKSNKKLVVVKKNFLFAPIFLQKIYVKRRML